MIGIRYNELWQATKARLLTAKKQRMLGPGKVYLEGEDYTLPEGPDTRPWGRLVVVPAATLWPNRSMGMAPTRGLPFIVRAELSNFKAPNWSPQVAIDAINEEIEQRLVGWHPTTFDRINVVIPIYLYAGAQSRPMWDDKRQVHWTSAHFRTEVSGRP